VAIVGIMLGLLWFLVASAPRGDEAPFPAARTAPPETVVRVAPAPAPRPKSPAVAVAADEAELIVVVVDDDGYPLRGVAIRLGGPTSPPRVTDARGEVSLRLPRGETELLVAGFRHRVTLREGEKRRFEVRLRGE